MDLRPCRMLARYTTADLSAVNVTCERRRSGPSRLRSCASSMTLRTGTYSPERPRRCRTDSASSSRSRVNRIASTGVSGSMNATRSVGPNAVRTNRARFSRANDSLPMRLMWYSSQKIRNTRTSSRPASAAACSRDLIVSDVSSPCSGCPSALTNLND